jgi:hypothetical protein
MKWVLKNFKKPSHILLVGTGQPSSKATGGHAVLFWASYLAEMYPDTIVRTVVDSSLAVSGPRQRAMFYEDPWGSVDARIPNWDTYPLDTTDVEVCVNVCMYMYVYIRIYILYIYIHMYIGPAAPGAKWRVSDAAEGRLESGRR